MPLGPYNLRHLPLLVLEKRHDPEVLQPIQLFELVQMFKSCQDDLLACLFDLPSQEHLVQYSIDLLPFPSQHPVCITKARYKLPCKS